MQIPRRPLRLTGLDLAASYRVTLCNPEDQARHSRGPTALKSSQLTSTGQVLMSQDLLFPAAWPATIWVAEAQRL